MSMHSKDDLRQMQMLPLSAKIEMTKERIRGWHDYWWRFGIENTKTGKTRFVTFDTREKYEPPLKETEWIKSAYRGAVYVSFSGGKDSTVLKHIVDSMYSDVPAVFVNTGLEYPEIQRFVREVKAGKYFCFNSDVEILRPEMRFDEVIKKYGYPVVSKEVSERIYYAKKGVKWAINCMNGLEPDGTESEFKKDNVKWKFLLEAPFPVSHKCCFVMKKKPAKKYEKETGRKPILGTMACESRLRATQWEKVGCNAFGSKRPRSAPLSFWTEQDILHYIKEFNIPYCSVYGEIKVDDKPEIEGQINWIDYLGCYEPEDKLTTTGCKQTGCMFCMFGCHLEKEPNRFQRMKITHPKQYACCMDTLGLKEVLEYIGVPYE